MEYNYGALLEKQREGKKTLVRCLNQAFPPKESLPFEWRNGGGDCPSCEDDPVNNPKCPNYQEFKLRIYDVKKLCMWKEGEQDPENTTFIPVRKNPDHKLYPCIACDGYNQDCIYNYDAQRRKNNNGII